MRQCHLHLKLIQADIFPIQSDILNSYFVSSQLRILLAFAFLGRRLRFLQHLVREKKETKKNGALKETDAISSSD